MIYTGVCVAAVIAVLAAALARDGRTWHALTSLTGGGDAHGHGAGVRSSGPQSSRSQRVSEVSTPTASSPVPADAERAAAHGCVDLEEHCAAWREMGECEKNAEFMHVKCAHSCGTCSGAPQAAAGGDSDEGAPWSEAARAARKRQWPKCKDKADECPFWASVGECEKNPTYMKVHCAISCDTCEWADFGKRCKRDPNAVPAVLPGELERTFSSLETDATITPLQPRVLSRDPWVVVFDSFLTADESDAILAVARREDEKHFKPSQGTGAMDEDGTLVATNSDYRTSWTNWCENDCLNTTAVMVLRDRAARVTRVPDANHEFPQFLRYDVSQYYKTHNDYIPAHRDMPCGPRMYTLFLYLTDVVEGGHTAFPRLGLKVEPKRGRAVLWPSVRNEQPMEIDERTEHVAEPVKRGMKYSINLWLHMFDFKANNKIGCTG